MKTMTSREIAELTGKRHDNVLRDIRVMLIDLYGEEGVLIDGDTPKEGLLRFEHTYQNQQNGQFYPEYRLDREHTDCLLTGYSAKARMAVIQRWNSFVPQLQHENNLLKKQLRVSELQIALNSIQAELNSAQTELNAVQMPLPLPLPFPTPALEYDPTPAQLPTLGHLARLANATLETAAKYEIVDEFFITAKSYALVHQLNVKKLYSHVNKLPNSDLIINPETNRLRVCLHIADLYAVFEHYNKPMNRCRLKAPLTWSQS